MRLAICGHGRHGKGTVAAWLRDNTPLRYAQSTSEAAAELVFSTRLGQLYGSARECWEDRHNRRAEWADIIWRHNLPLGITLYEDMVAKNDLIEGIRRPRELAECLARGIVDAAVWVDASKRLPAELSCEVSPADCGFVIDNNGPWCATVAALRDLCCELSIPCHAKGLAA